MVEDVVVGIRTQEFCIVGGVDVVRNSSCAKVEGEVGECNGKWEEKKQVQGCQIGQGGRDPEHFRNELKENENYLCSSCERAYLFC